MGKFIMIALVAVAAPAAATDFSVMHQSSDGNLRYLHVQAGDVDGDGIADTAVIRLTCDRGSVSSAALYSPRDAASGQAGGKRMHKPFTIVKEWSAAPPSLAGARGNWDLATMKGAKTMAMDDWSPVRITGVDAACSLSNSANKVSVSDLSVTK